MPSWSDASTTDSQHVYAYTITALLSFVRVWPRAATVSVRSCASAYTKFAERALLRGTACPSQTNNYTAIVVPWWLFIDIKIDDHE